MEDHLAIRDFAGAAWSVDEVLADLELGETSELRRRHPDMRFSNAAVAAGVQLIGSFPSEVELRTGVVKGTSFHPCSISLGHVLIGTTWHRVEPSSACLVVRVLDSLGIASGPIRPRDYVRILAAVDVIPYVRNNCEHAPAAEWVEAIPESPAPLGLNASLYPYQAAGYSFLSEVAAMEAGALLADEMGLGKTLQAIALLLRERPRGASLVVAPAALLENWRREMNRFAPNMNVLVHSGAARTGVVSGLSGHDVVLVSYETLSVDISVFDSKSWNIVVLDEAQRVRNPDSQRSRVVKQLRRRVSIAVTGTPVENRLTDAWSIAEFVLPSLLGAREAFEVYFPDHIDAASRLGAIMSPVTIRRTVDDVALDLPQKVEIPVAFELPLSDRRMYESGFHDAEVPVQIRRVVCAHAYQVDGLSTDQLRNSPKYVHLALLLDEAFARGEKVLVFASFQESIDRLTSCIAEDFPGAFVHHIDGRVHKDLRYPLIDQFSVHPGGGVLVMNPAATGVGLNITAANHVVHFNPEWNPAVTAQATARSFRRGQTRPVFAYHYYYVDTVEERAMHIAADKEALASAVGSGLRSGMPEDQVE